MGDALDQADLHPVAAQVEPSDFVARARKVLHRGNCRLIHALQESRKDGDPRSKVLSVGSHVRLMRMYPSCACVP